MIARGGNYKQVPINIIGGSVFGRYPKISNERTYNMFQSDSFMVPYAGYEIAISSSQFINGQIGRGCFTSVKLGRLVLVIDDNVFLANITFSQQDLKVTNSQIFNIGKLQTASGIVYITENNKPQIAISDGVSIYIYDPTLTPNFQKAKINFVPGYITFHDTYFICAARADTFYSPPANNTWRLSGQNDGLTWDDNSSSIGILQTKPDNVQAVVRFPSKGNMILVMGSNVTESWFDVGAQLFPYQRQNQYNFDYGCLNPATVAYMDEMVVWLAKNEKSGPVIAYSNGGLPQKITTDGIDYLFSTLNNPQDAQGFLYRQDGHLFYHINFYTDNFSLFYDFNTGKIYNASDQDLNYFIAAQVAFFNNQYYFVTRNSGNLFALDTQYTQYQDVLKNGQVVFHEIPRIRTCKNIRLPTQEYFVANDVGFTIETGETNYQEQNLGPINIITEDGNDIITEGSTIFLTTETSDYLETEDGTSLLLSEQSDPTGFSFLIMEQDEIINTTPAVDLSISYDGGASFSNDFRYVLPGVGQRRNRLMWWQLGVCNDLVCQFKFWSIGRAVITDGVLNIRQ